MFRGKKYKESAKLIDRSVQYDPNEALDLVLKGASAKFDETVELHIKLGVDSRHADQQVRGAVVLPNGTGKTRRVLVFAKDAKIDEALAAGADYAGGMELVEKITKENWFEFDVVALGEHQNASGLTGTVGQNDCTTNLLVSVTGVNAQADVDLDGLIELCLGSLANQSQSLGGIVHLALVDQLCAVGILLSNFSHFRIPPSISPRR